METCKILTHLVANGILGITPMPKGPQEVDLCIMMAIAYLMHMLVWRPQHLTYTYSVGMPPL